MIQKLTDLGTRVFIYDHHRPGEGMPHGENPNLFCMNPAQNRNAAPYPTCLFGSELLDDKGVFEKQVLYMGLYTETWLERLPLFHDFSPALQESLKETARRIHGSFLVQDESTTHHALKFLLKAQAAGSLDQAPGSSEEHRILSNIHDLIQHEKTWLMKLVVASIKKLLEPRYILLGVESKIRVCGLMASELRWKYPGLVVGIWQKWDDRFICELRRGTASAVDLASLIEGMKNEVPVLTGGGHPEAAAFTAREDAFSQALKAIKTKLTERGEVFSRE
jgi:hypothetical protein